MLGTLLTLVSIAFLDLLVNRSRYALRGVIFISLTGSTAVLLTGLPEFLFPELPVAALMVLKASLGPLSGAVTLTYQRMWLESIGNDPLVFRISVIGGFASLLATFVLGGLAAFASPVDFNGLLLAAATVNTASIFLGLVTAFRASALGDPLARWMVVASLCMAGMVGGLYGHALQFSGLGLLAWILTALCTIAYFLVVTALTLERNRQHRRLKRLAGLPSGVDPATGLPTGSVLLSKIDDAFWRTARVRGQCTVLCLYLHNLYELGESAGHGSDLQILSAMTARIRRAVGFHCVIGLYQPRCFVVVISASKNPHALRSSVQRLTYLIKKPVSVIALDAKHYAFSPNWGIGEVTVNASNADPIAILNEAERLAQAPESAT